MQTADFDFDLPPDRIADHPATPRDAARLLRVGEGLADLSVGDLPGLLAPNDLLVCNDTRVLPARLTGRRGAVRVEASLLKAVAPDAWTAFAKPGKRLKLGDAVEFAPGFSAHIAEKREGGEVVLRFEASGAELMALIQRFGAMPLPPYIRRPQGAETGDEADYQTIFAAREGAVAAPTAGLHFTAPLLAAIEARGVKRLAVTLHVGAGTFLPVKVEDPSQHRMHAEYGEITPEVAAAINAHRQGGGRVVAIGTTALRLLESAARPDGALDAFARETDIFITPGYRFRVVDRLMTNFHLPRSTLFMLVSAFSGVERMRAAYAHAIQSGYRFYSYGDACLLERNL